MSETPDERGENALHRTLRSLGAAHCVESEILEYAPPSLRSIGVTYQHVNERLAQTLRKSPLAIRHVTGEARALVDPFHRQILRRARAAGQPGELGCYLAGSDAPSAFDFLALQRAHWEFAEWSDFIDILGLVAEGDLRLHVMREQATVHFSLFGDDLVLLQDEHHHPTAEKWVWFLRSKELVDALSPKVVVAYAESSPITPADCRALLLWLYSYEVVATSSKLQNGDDLATAEERDIWQRLKRLGFAEKDSPGLTRIGADWLVTC
jgi:hypothetical protein